MFVDFELDLAQLLFSLPGEPGLRQTLVLLAKLLKLRLPLPKARDLRIKLLCFRGLSQLALLMNELLDSARGLVKGLGFILGKLSQ